MTTLPLPVVPAPPPYQHIAVLRLEQPGRPVVVLDAELLRRLEAALAAIPRDAQGVIVASASERAFVAGADLRTISDASDADLSAYLAEGARILGLLATLPVPTAAAINGAALGGGLELAMHCDGLIAAPPPARDGQSGKPYPVGLPEASLGLCPGWGGTNLLPARIDPATALRLAATGETLLFDAAVNVRLFDAVAPSVETLIVTAARWLAEHAPALARDGAPLRWIGRPDVRARVEQALANEALPETPQAAAVRHAVATGLTQGWHAALRIEQWHLVRLRHEATARTALASFFARSAPRSNPP